MRLSVAVIFRPQAANHPEKDHLKWRFIEVLLPYGTVDRYIRR
jgi:hypothetical protein